MYFLLILFALVIGGCGTSRYDAWYQSLTPDQQAAEDQRRHERGLAALQAYTAMQANRRAYESATPYYQPSQPIMIAPRQRTNCTTNLYGNQATTNCY